MRQQLTALSALIAAVEEGSLRAAARRPKLSQPAVTKMIRELEREVAAPVLQRSTGGVLPTPQAMRTFAAEYPAAQVCVRKELCFGLSSLLREGAVVLAICPIPQGLAPGEFEIEPLMTLEMAVVARPGHPLARVRHLRQLREAAWVFTSRSGKSSDARRLFEAAGLEPPEPRCIVNSTLALLSLVCQGDHIALMPLVLARHPSLAPHLAIIPLQEGPLALPLGALTRREGMLKPALRQFMLHLHRAVGHAGAGW